MEKPMINQIYIFLALFLLSCEYDDRFREQKGHIIGTIMSAELNHVLLKREGCRFSRMYFWVKLENKTKYLQKLKFYGSDYCDIHRGDLEYINLYCLSKFLKKPLSFDINDKDTLLLVKSGESLMVKFKVIPPIGSNFQSMKQIRKKYNSFLQNPFKIIYRHKKENLIFRKGINFKIDFVVDDIPIDENDSLYRKFIPVPFRPRWSGFPQ